MNNNSLFVYYNVLLYRAKTTVDCKMASNNCSLLSNDLSNQTILKVPRSWSNLPEQKYSTKTRPTAGTRNI